jgi:amidase
VVGLKPTVGLTSRAGVVPISWTQDSVGVHGRSVRDVAAVLGALTGVDPRDPATARSEGRAFRDYLQFVDPDGLRGARIGVPRQLIGTVTAETDATFENMLNVLFAGGAEVVDVELPSFAEFEEDLSEIIVLLYELRRGLDAYLRTRPGVQANGLEALIRFNVIMSSTELAYFGQEFLEISAEDFYSDDEYRSALERGRRLAADQGIDAALRAHGLDALVAPTNGPAWPIDLLTGDDFLYSSARYAAVAGYPLVTVPMGAAFELPLGITFMGTAWSEPTLIRLASAFEARTPGVRRRPRFLRTFRDVTRTEAEIFRNNPVPPPVEPEPPQPPVEPVRIFWSGSGSRQPRAFGPFRRVPEPTDE